MKIMVYTTRQNINIWITNQCRLHYPQFYTVRQMAPHEANVPQTQLCFVTLLWKCINFVFFLLVLYFEQNANVKNIKYKTENT